jgi:magnesium-protoporphyrin IX monomethyl ester (oxidative) cyclase
LDVENPEFYRRLDVCFANNNKLTEITQSNSNGLVKLFKKLPLYISNAVELISLYLMQPIRVEATHGTAR